MRSASSFKVTFPGTEALLPRPRQIAALDDCVLHAPVVWLMGLPGAGKTALAAQWALHARARGWRCLWYRLDEDDVDIAGVFDALRHHPAHVAGPGASDPVRALPAWSPDNQAELAAFTRQFFGQLSEGVEGVEGTPVAVVFDDCHRVPDDSTFFEMLDAAREPCGPAEHPRLRLLLISRRPAPARIERGALAGWLRHYDDLALSMDEAVALAQRVSGRSWSPVEATALQHTQGWMAHVLAVARAYQPQSVARQAGAVTERVGEYLCTELLLMLPADEQRCFRLLAELPVVPRSLVRQGTVSARLARFLDDLARAGYFVETTASDAWRLHDLLRDGLRERNALADPPQALAEARAAWAACVADEAPDTAMGLLVAVGDAPGVLALLRRHGRAWLARGRHRQVLGWLSGLSLSREPAPGEAMSAASRTLAELMLWCAEAQLPLEPEAARPLLARSRGLLVQQGQADLAYRAWCGEVASYVVQWGAVQGLAELVDELEAMSAHLGPPTGEWRFRTTADALTALMYGRAEDPRLRRYAQETARAVEHAPDKSSGIIAAAQLLIYRMWWAGDYPGGRALYSAFDAEVEADTDLAPLPRLIWWSNAAVVDWTCGDPQRCYAKVDQGLALADATGVHVRDFFLLTQGLFCALSQDDLARAKGYLDRLSITARGHPRLDVMVHHFFRSWYCLAQDDVHTALAHAEAAHHVAQTIGSLFHKVITYSVLAPARLHTGDVAGAQAAYRAQMALAKASDNLPFTYIAFCAGAEIALLTGDDAALHKQIERILTVKQLGGFHSDCGWRSAMRARWMAFALEQGLLPEVARQWIVQKRLTRPAAYLGPWPAPVRIEALQGLRVDVESDKPTAVRAKPATKLREMLGILVVHREGVAQDDLCDWLWPQSDGDKAAASLKASVHRLRAWLGADTVKVRDGLVRLDAQQVDCDLWHWWDDPSRSTSTAKTLDPAQVLAGCRSAPVVALRQTLAARQATRPWPPSPTTSSRSAWPAERALPADHEPISLGSGSADPLDP